MSAAMPCVRCVLAAPPPTRATLGCRYLKYFERSIGEPIIDATRGMTIVKSMKQTIMAATLTAAMVAGCGGNEVVAPTVSVSVGQQLIDLKKARDSGALSENDYQRQKQSLIDGVQ